MILSSALLSLFSLFAKFAIENTSFFLLTFLRFSIPFVLMLPYLLWTCTFRELFSTRSIKLQFLRSACVLVYQYSIFYYLLHSTLLNVTVLQNTFPLFLPILERIFFKHPFHKREIISIFVCFAGVLCILQPNRGVFESLSIVALLAPLGQAGSQVLFGHQARHENPKSTLFYLYFLCSVVTAIAYLCSSEFFDHKNSLEYYTLFTWANIIALGVVSIFNQNYRGKAYQYAKPSTLAPFLYFSLIFSAILDWAVFQRLPNGLSIAGAALVIAGGWIQVFRGNRKSRFGGQT
jgi:drug/metabolite transporter (DMT)-like permease